MGYLLKMLCDMLQNPQQLSHIHIYPKPKCQTRPHRFDLSGATEFILHSHYQTLISSVSPMGSRSHRDGLANSLLPVVIISVSPKCAIGPTEFA